MDIEAHYKTKEVTTNRKIKRKGKEYSYPYKSKVYVCNHCEKECRNLPSFKMHLTTHSDKISPKFALQSTPKPQKTMIEKVKKEEGVLEEKAKEKKVLKQVKKASKKQKKAIKKRVEKATQTPSKPSSEPIESDYFGGFYD